jgi:hypothetical protein
MKNPILLPNILNILLMATILAGCGLTAPAATPTIDIEPTLETIRTEAAGTAFAEMTRSAPSATPTPTETLTPTYTPTPPPSTTPTRTRTPILWTWTPTLPSGGCIVVGQSPDSGSSFLPDAGFDARWDIKNTSGETWYQDQVRIRYVSGAVLQTKSDEARLAGDVGPGSSVPVIVDMQAPSRPGTYVANWAVYRNQQVQCGLTVRIRVSQ